MSVWKPAVMRPRYDVEEVLRLALARRTRRQRPRASSSQPSAGLASALTAVISCLLPVARTAALRQRARRWATRPLPRRLLPRGRPDPRCARQRERKQRSQDRPGRQHQNRAARFARHRRTAPTVPGRHSLPAAIHRRGSSTSPGAGAARRPARRGVAEDDEDENDEPCTRRAGRGRIPAVAVPLAKTVSTPIAHIATTWPENTSKHTRSMTTLRIPATIDNSRAPQPGLPRAACSCSGGCRSTR